MDLRNNQITLGELMDHPGARNVLRKRFPKIVQKPLGNAARTVTLEQLLAIVGPYLPGILVNDALRELKKV